MLRVTIKAEGRLATTGRVSRDGMEVNVPQGVRVRDLLAEVGILDSEVKRITVNGRRARLDQALRRNDDVEVSS
jgi:sulfur carrier protein ThiS